MPSSAAWRSFSLPHHADVHPRAAEVAGGDDLGDADDSCYPRVFDLARNQMADFRAQQFIDTVDAPGAIAHLQEGMPGVLSRPVRSFARGGIQGSPSQGHRCL